jgi:hypothetical protein
MKLFQSYVIESDGTKRPMTKEEHRELRFRLSIVPITLPIALFVLLFNKLFKDHTLPTKE